MVRIYTINKFAVVYIVVKHEVSLVLDLEAKWRVIGSSICFFCFLLQVMSAGGKHGGSSFAGVQLQSVSVLQLRW